MGAALAFYATFSIAPVLVIAIAIAGSVFGPEAARGEVVAQISGLTGTAEAEAIQGLLAGAYSSELGFWASVIAGIMLLMAATSMFAELKDSMDVIWGRTGPERSDIMTLLRGRLFSFGLILFVAYLLLASLIVSAALAALQKSWGAWFGDVGWLLYAFNDAFSLVVVFALFAAIFKWLPDPPVAWRDVAVGAGVTTALFTLGKFLIGLYLGNSGAASGFGAAGSLIVMLLWVYYSSQIFFWAPNLPGRTPDTGDCAATAQVPITRSRVPRPEHRFASCGPLCTATHAAANCMALVVLCHESEGASADAAVADRHGPVAHRQLTLCWLPYGITSS